MGVHTRVFPCVPMLGASIQKYCCGAQILQLLFSSHFFFFFVYSFEVVFLEPSVSFEGTLSSILQIRDVTLFCFLLPSFLDNFPFAHVPTTPDCCLFSSLRLFFVTSSEPICLSSFYLTTPLFTHSSTIFLKWPHLPPLILFVPYLNLSLSFSPSALLPVSVHRPFTLSSNPITFSLLSFILPALFLPSPAISPSTSHPSGNTHLPPLWAFDTLLLCLLIHSSSFCHLFTAFLLRSPSLPLFYYLQNWSPSLLIFNRNFALTWFIYVLSLIIFRSKIKCLCISLSRRLMYTFTLLWLLQQQGI